MCSAYQVFFFYVLKLQSWTYTCRKNCKCKFYQNLIPRVKTLYFCVGDGKCFNKTPTVPRASSNILYMLFCCYWQSGTANCVHVPLLSPSCPRLPLALAPGFALCPSPWNKIFLYPRCQPRKTRSSSLGSSMRTPPVGPSEGDCACASLHAEFIWCIILSRQHVTVFLFVKFDFRMNSV